MTKSTFFFTALLLLMLLSTSLGCDSDVDHTQPAYDTYRFDQKVINKLAMYDSLVIAIHKQLPLFQSLNGNDRHQPFRYSPSSTDENVFKRLPPEAGTAIDHHFAKLGNNFISGFDAF